MRMNDANTPEQPIHVATDARKIGRLRHFTTNSGVTGILATGAVSSRSRLEEREYLDRIYYPNCEVRVDLEWVDNVSISITDINDSFFGICSGASKWHAGMDGFWAVIEIDPVILEHTGVTFTTTNNRYSNVSRRQGVEGLEEMFADVVYPYQPKHRSPVLRRDGLASNQPTDPQAEVLYPGSVSAEHITGILLRTAKDALAVRAQVEYFSRRVQEVGEIPVRVDPSAFATRTTGVASLPPGSDPDGDV